LLLDKTSEQIQGDQSFRIESEGQYRVVFRRNGGAWELMYRFTLEPHQFTDYEEMSRFHQTSPQSHFTQNRICSRATLAGRITLSGMRFIVTTNQGREERLLDSAKEYEAVLRDQFGIVMNHNPNAINES
jgi:N-hydroxyarylamine O-acetyltransferase